MTGVGRAGLVTIAESPSWRGGARYISAWSNVIAPKKAGGGKASCRAPRSSDRSDAGKPAPRDGFCFDDEAHLAQRSYFKTEPRAGRHLGLHAASGRDANVCGVRSAALSSDQMLRASCAARCCKAVAEGRVHGRGECRYPRARGLIGRADPLSA